MTQVLLLTLGSRGDVQPFIALGQALAAVGHGVTVGTGQGFEALIRGAGLQAHSFSIDYRALAQEEALQRALVSPWARVRAFQRVLGLLRAQMSEMLALIEALRPDVMVVHPKALAAEDIGEALGIPVVPALLQPAFEPTAAFPALLTAPRTLGRCGNRVSHLLQDGLLRTAHRMTLGNWRQQALGLPRRSRRGLGRGVDPGGRPVPRLHAYSAHLVPRPDDWPPEALITGAWTVSSPAQAALPPPLAAFLAAGPPPIYVGFGSMPGGPLGDRLAQAVAGALRLTGLRAVVASGWGGLQALASLVADKPGEVCLLDAVPHDLLFPHCAVVVHHGGAGTTHAGLRAGRPSILCPFGVDQPFWGQRVAACGAGPSPLPARHLTAETLAAALVQAQAPSIRAGATAAQKAMAGEGGAATALGALGPFLS